MSGQENNASNTRADGNGENPSPMIPYSPNSQPQNSFPSYNMQYSQGMAVPPSPGLGQMYTPVRTSYRNGYYFGNNSYDQAVTVSSQQGYSQSPISLRFQQHNGAYANHPQHYQGANAPQNNAFARASSPLSPFAPVPQFCNAPQRYTPSNNGFRSPVAGTARQQAIAQYNSPLHVTTPVAPNSSGRTLMPPYSQYLSTPIIGNRSDQNWTNSQVPQAPQWRAKGSSLPRSTPAGKSDGSGSATPEAEIIAIQRKPAMVPKKYHLRAEHLMPGCIVWLSNYQEGHEPILCVQNHECNDKVKEKDGRNHPVMILRINQRHGSNIVGDVILDVALMTTLGGLTLDKYVQKLRTLGPDPSKQWYLRETMPLSWAPLETPQLKGSKLDALKKREHNQESQHHAELNQRGNNLLFLSRGSMQRRSYMRVHHIYAVPIKQLQACSRYAKLAHMVRLDECGYRRVTEVLKLVPEPWESSIERSVMAAPQRLRNLRDEEMAQVNAIQLAESQPRQDEAVMQQGLSVAQQSPLGNASDVEAEGRESC
ncbi:hypothetical protein BCON_0010g00300 [Botryotinia convoluta]|uniref:Uncharacterized protein n=1 Tax=Botryotinia convoluta TaxID=54673 RepID=A0A4Z1IR97_9HELO|nr:hypothetical protein BCON_0010g00300 [Botryotinia convoluta]